MKRISRRAFVSGMAAGAVGSLLNRAAGATAGGDDGPPPAPDGKPTEPTIQTYNELGKTGIKVSDVMFGAGAVYESGVVRYAFDRGITAFDTAAGYTGGLSEEDVGEGLKGVRDQAVIITKQGVSSRRPFDRHAAARTLETSLRKLRTDHVDGLFIHSMDSLDPLRNEEVLNTFLRFKREGKVRFTGFSTHDEKVCLAECIKPEYEEFVDAVMFRYNHMEGKPIEPLIARLRKKGIGTIAMKTLAGGKHGKLEEFVDDQMTYPQAAVAWVLDNPGIDSAVLSMENYALIDIFVGASGKELERTDQSLLRKYGDAVGATYCRVTCTACERACPHNVAISDIMRYAMYFEDYGHEKRAMTHYAALHAGRKPDFCGNCSGPCTRACPYGIAVRERLVRARGLLTI